MARMQLTAASVRPSEICDPMQQRAWARMTYCCIAILALAGVFTCCCDTPMIWDGSYQFCFSLIKQRPYFYLTRFHSYVLWLPMVWLSHFTDNLTLLKLAYGLPFTLAPAFSLLASWWIVKERAPRLIVWAIFGVAASPLPGQIFIINDSIFQQHMFWPVFLGLLVPLRRAQMVFLSLLVIFQFSHQIGLVLLTGGATAAGLLALRDRPNRKESLLKSGILLVLALIALWKILHFPDSYAQQEMTHARIHESWQYGVEGYPIRGVMFMCGAGLCVLVHGLMSRARCGKLRSVIVVIVGLCIAGAFVNWTIWAVDAEKWSTAANYRRWVVPLTIPFYLLAFLDRLIVPSPRMDSSGLELPMVVGVSVAATFFVILSIQSIIWVRLTRHLMRDLESDPATIVPWSRVSWDRNTAMYHWGTTSYVFVLEGRTPRKLLLEPTPEGAAKQLDLVNSLPPLIPLWSFTPIPPTPGPAGFFDFRPMLNAIRQEKPVPPVKRTGKLLSTPIP